MPSCASSHPHASAVCGYGQPYNSTSGTCYVSGPAAAAPDASIKTCPRGTAFDTFEQQCVYVGDLPTPTFPSTSTVWCSPSKASLVRNLAGPKPYTCQGPPVIAPPSAIVIGTGTGQGALVKTVQGVPAYPIVAEVTGATTVIVSDGTITTTKTLGGGSPYDIPPVLNPVFGNYSTGQLNPNSTFTVAPSATPGTTLYGSIGTLTCAALSNTNSTVNLAISNPKLFAACVDALQYGCPTADQLSFWGTVNRTINYTSLSPTTPTALTPGSINSSLLSPPAPSVPGGSETTNGSIPGSILPNRPDKDAFAEAMWAETERLVNESRHKIDALLG